MIAPPVVVAPPAPKPAIRKGIIPLEKVNPIFPREAIRAGVQKGHVIARLFIDEKGLVSEVRIVEADMADRAGSASIRAGPAPARGS